jgi:hypothetical protein
MEENTFIILVSFYQQQTTITKFHFNFVRCTTFVRKNLKLGGGSKISFFIFNSNFITTNGSFCVRLLIENQFDLIALSFYSFTFCSDLS